MRRFLAVAGLVFNKLGFEPAPLVLGFVLGPLMEENPRRALLMGRGDWSVFVTSPIAGTMIASAVLTVVTALPSIKKKRQEVFVEDWRNPAAPIGRRIRKGTAFFYVALP